MLPIGGLAIVIILVVVAIIMFSRGSMEGYSALGSIGKNKAMTLNNTLNFSSSPGSSSTAPVSQIPTKTKSEGLSPVMELSGHMNNNYSGEKTDIPVKREKLNNIIANINSKLLELYPKSPLNLVPLLPSEKPAHINKELKDALDKFQANFRSTDKEPVLSKIKSDIDGLYTLSNNTTIRPQM